MSEREADVVGLVRRGIVAFLRGDRADALAVASPKVIAVRATSLPEAQTYHGHDGIESLLAEWTAEFDGVEMTTGWLAEIEGRILVEVIQRGAGETYEIGERFWFVYTVADRKVIRMDIFASEAEALGALA
jgi:ketosteroid isomerase-like protein